MEVEVHRQCTGLVTDRHWHEHEHANRELWHTPHTETCSESAHCKLSSTKQSKGDMFLHFDWFTYVLCSCSTCSSFPNFSSNACSSSATFTSSNQSAYSTAIQCTANRIPNYSPTPSNQKSYSNSIFSTYAYTNFSASHFRRNAKANRRPEKWSRQSWYWSNVSFCHESWFLVVVNGRCANSKSFLEVLSGPKSFSRQFQWFSRKTIVTLRVRCNQ